MADKPDRNEDNPEWIRHQHETAQQAMRAMLRDHGDFADFIEPLDDPKFVEKETLQTNRILESAFEETLVSSNPDIATPIGEAPSAPLTAPETEPEPEPPQEPETPPEPPEGVEPPPETDTASEPPDVEPPVSESSDATEVQAEPPPETETAEVSDAPEHDTVSSEAVAMPSPPMGAALPPGLGRPLRPGEDREQAIREHFEQRGVDQKEPVRRSAGSEKNDPPDRAGMPERAPAGGVGPRAHGGEVIGDFGSPGTSFYKREDADTLATAADAESAADAITNAGEVMLVLFRRLVLIAQRHEQEIEQLLDRVEGEEDGDEY